MNKNVNITVKDLTPNTYAFAYSGVTDCVQEFFCKEDGAIIITPIVGDTFTWNAKNGEKIKVIPKKIIINSGEFLAFLSFYKDKTGSDSPLGVVYYVIDENGDDIIDEINNKFTLK